MEKWVSVRKPHYEIVCAYTLEELSMRVNSWAQDGFKPKGGVAVVMEPLGTVPTMIFYQAVYRSGLTLIASDRSCK